MARQKNVKETGNPKVTRYPHIDPLDVVSLPEDQNVLFYWMPKCAGGSIRDMFYAYYPGCFYDYNNQIPGHTFDPALKAATFYHSHIPSLLANGFLPQQWFDNVFGFAIVRNTWDRMVSLFHYLKRTRYVGKECLDQSTTFDEFIKAVVTRKYPKPGPLNLVGYYQANSLLSWLRPNDVWLPHHIGRFENLAAEWMLISKILGVEHQSLPVTNTSTHAPYQEYYTDRIRTLVAEHFAEEIDVFEFTFDRGAM